MSNPYSSKPADSFWKLGVATRPWREVMPFSRTVFPLGASDVVSTAGSCFAQNLAKFIKREKLMHFLEVEEVGEGQPLFSARYGNIYTSLQLQQLLERALGTRVDDAQVTMVRAADGRHYDLLRPYIFDGGFASASELAESRAEHLKAVRKVFADATVFVFTLGLTECWLSAKDGTAYPVCPAAAFPDADAPESEFRNLSYQESLDALLTSIDLIRGINPSIKILLTVSPVPLTATYTDEHVMVATCHSKSILRALCSAAVEARPAVGYFPSYEIISAPFFESCYYQANRRSVTDEGIEHVMAAFRHSYFAEGERAAPQKAVPQKASGLFSDADDDVICDEDESMKSLGF